MAEKRVRSVNWESDEKQLLREIMKEYLPLMECRGNETNVVQRKRKAWQDVTVKFNALNTKERDVKQLMMQWKTMKIKSKKEFSDYQRESRKTGGGPRPKSPSQETVEILGMTPTSFYEDTNVYDSDSCRNVSVAPLASCSYERFVDLVDVCAPAPLCVVPNAPPAVVAPPANNTPPLIAPTPSTRDFSVRRSSNNEFDLKKKTFESMERYRKREDERLQKEHELRLKCYEEQHMKMLHLMSLQEQILLKEL